MNRLTIMILAVVTLGGTAYAHSGMIHIMGTVSSITDHDISVKGTDGKTQTAVFTATTKFSNMDIRVTAKDIKVGDHVVIHATKRGDLLSAEEVKVGTMKQKGMSGEMSGMKIDKNPSKPNAPK